LIFELDNGMMGPLHEELDEEIVEGTMKRLRIFGVLLLVAGAGFLAAQSKIVLKVKVQRANVRSEMSLTAPVIREVPLGTLLEASQKSGEWYEVAITNDLGVSLTGYIHMNTVDEVGGGEEAPPPKPKAKPATPAPPPVYTETPIEDRGYAPMKSGFKVMAAYGLASYSYKSDPDTAILDKYKKSLGGIAAGIGYESGGQFGLEIDVMYLPKGVHYKGSTSDFGVAGTFEMSVKTAQVSVPVLLKLTVASNPGIYLLGGGEIAYVLSAKAGLKYDIQGIGSGSEEEDFKENIKPLDYGVVFGGGISLPMGSSRLFVEARYHMGMANLQKSNTGYEGAVPSDFNPKTSLLLVAGGIRF